MNYPTGIRTGDGVEILQVTEQQMLRLLEIAAERACRASLYGIHIVKSSGKEQSSPFRAGNDLIK